MSTGPVRTRVAPSPTGDPHVGTAYQALFNYCFARANGGVFLLRIEDTDQARSTTESETAILESLRWLGLDWDEGPDKGGAYGPYRQSERVELHREHAHRLLSDDNAYRCFCTPERLARMREEQRARGLAGYDRLCRSIPAAESAKRADAGEAHTIRMKIPTEGVCTFRDLLRGDVEREWALIDDQVLLKSDGFPTYHLANVVDDHLMAVSHVIRGEEWLNSVPKHVLLYEYFGWEAPVFCHLALLRNADAKKTKLSKRKNPTSIGYYRRVGFLPEAMRNFLGLMGWGMADGREKFTLDEMVEAFRLEDMTLGGPVFDTRKMRWLNGRYLREDRTPAELVTELKTWAFNDARLEAIAPLAQPRLETLSDWAYLTAFFFADEVPLDPTDLTLKGKEPADLAAILQMVIWELEKMRRVGRDEVQAMFERMGDRLDLKLRDLTRPFYVAVSGNTASTPLYDSIELLGSDLTRMRLRRAIESLGGLSSKKLKATQKEYDALFGGDPWKSPAGNVSS